MSVRRIWKTLNTVVDDDFIQSCGGNRILAILLKNRGIDSIQKVSDFLNPLKFRLSNPNVFVDMSKSVDRIASAIEKNEHITVYGDFDSDGITSTALLYLTLKEIGANVDFYLPDRAIESHGLNTKALVQIIAKRKSKLIITVDCGISNVTEVNFAKGFNTDVIITDHHEAPELIPSAFAIINPKVQNALEPNISIEEIQSLSYLAGVGVAFKLACSLLEKYKKEEFVNEILPLVAIGTIGDVVELLAENRSLVSMGLELIKAGKHIGIQKLLKESGIDDNSNVTSENIAFSIVPRLNAAGRLESPNTAINVLISKDEQEILSSINTLNDLNRLRQELCEETFVTANSMYEQEFYNYPKSIILFHEDWHIGVIGIVSSKLVEKYNKPVFLMTRDANSPNIIRCSCRSIEGINVHSVLSQHKELFNGFGGHKMAAGFSFDETKISFVEFKKLLNKTIIEFSQNVDFNQITINADMELDSSDISLETVSLINKLQPFGAANPSPLFVIKDAQLNSFRFMGQNNNHLKINVSKSSINSFDCVKWNCPDFNLPTGSQIDILFALKSNTFNGNTSVQLMLEDFYSELLQKKSKNSDIKILDHRNKKNIIFQVVDFIKSTKKTTAIYLQNPSILKQLSDDIVEKVFDSTSIPSNIEQLMFFESPSTKEEFIKIIETTKASLVHLMNFDISEITTDSFISKFSGMLKYAVSNLNGVVNITRAVKALSVNEDILECALNMFEVAGMINLEKDGDDNFIIDNLNPIELSKVKQSELFVDLEEKLNDINSFRKFYLNSTIEDIKSNIL